LHFQLSDDLQLMFLRLCDFAIRIAEGLSERSTSRRGTKACKECVPLYFFKVCVRLANQFVIRSFRFRLCSF